MSSKVKASKVNKNAGKQQIGTTAATQSPQGPVYVDSKTGNLLIKIQAKPGAKFNGITDINEEGVGVQIGK